MQQEKNRWLLDTWIGANDVDINGIAKQSVLLRHVEEGIFMQHETFGPSIESLRADKDMGFILSKVAARIDEPIRAGSHIHVETWAAEPKGFTFMRYARITCMEKVVAEYALTWALVRLSERTLVRGGTGGEIELGFGFMPAIDVGVSLRARFPKDAEIESTAKHVTSYSEADENGHMNNTFYPDLLCGVSDMRGKRIAEYTLSYLKEAPIGVGFEISAACRDGLLYVTTALDSGENGATACFRLVSV